MSGDNATKEGENPNVDSVRGRSSIEFPYLDLDAAIEVAVAVHAVSGSHCKWDQLAGHMKQAPGGGGFRMRVMTARLFGLLDYDRGSVTLTDLGIRSVDPKHSRQARADAFLNVPLYKALLEKLRGQMMPPTAAIERMIEGLGVAPKQKDKARQVFMRSAKQAGYFEIDSERLISPPINKTSHSLPSTGGSSHPPPPHTGGGSDGSGGGDDNGLDPLINGLVKRLPKTGSKWPISSRIKWLQATASNFELIYEADESEQSSGILISSSNKGE